MMNFRIGPSPEVEFDRTGWNQLFGKYALQHRPHAMLEQAGALVVSLALLGSLLWLADSVVPNLYAASLLFGPWALEWWEILLGGLLLVPLHELFHALLHPGFGLTNATTLGFIPSRLAFYAHYEGETSRTRLLVGIAAPFVALSLLPIALASVMNVGWQLNLVACALLNGLLSASDLLTFLAVLTLVPPRATVRRFGWRLFWRVEE